MLKKIFKLVIFVLFGASVFNMSVLEQDLYAQEKISIMSDVITDLPEEELPPIEEIPPVEEIPPTEEIPPVVEQVVPDTYDEEKYYYEDADTLPDTGEHTKEIIILAGMMMTILPLYLLLRGKQKSNID